ncbi:MAG: F0F1 ATP synthase subunit A [Longimicrobiaceae bacterium]
MIARIALLAALVAANPLAAQHGAGAERALQPASPQVEAAAAGHLEDEGHGDGIDFMHHILDSREIELPGTTLHLPAEGSWMLGGIDMTPTKHVVFLGIAALLTLLVLLFGASRAGRASEGRTSGKRHNAIEAVVLFIRDQVVMPNVGHGGEKFAPFVITLFFFILFANLLGLIPYGSTATANISVTAALALMSFVVVEVGGMVALGPRGYLGTIFFVPKGMNPVAAWAMAIALAPVEAMGKITKPIALAIRLMANMTAGHIVLLAIISLIFVFGSFAIAVAPVLMGVAITFLEIFVSLLQAYIFAMLTSVFIGLMRHAH